MGDTVLTQPAAGGEIPRTPEEAAAVKQAFGTPEVSSASQDAAARAERLRAEADTVDAKITTFVEGVTDALSAGFIRETGAGADRRRDVNKGSAIAGNILGTLIAIETGAGPTGAIAETGEAAGQMVARGLLRREAGSIAERALSEAGAGAALTTAQAFGHQLMDSVMEDREFSGEAILHEAKLGGLIGLGGGTVLGVFGKVGSRAEVAAQEGLLGAAEGASKHFDEAISAYDQALEHHGVQVGMLRELQAEGRLGPVSDGFMDVRRAALKDAERAQAALKELDTDKALSGSDPELYRQWAQRAARYRDSVRELDDIMRPDAAELAAEGELRRGQAITHADEIPAGLGGAPERNFRAAMDEHMAGSPEARAKYEAIYGRPYEPLPTEPAQPGGVETPTSGLKTGLQRPNPGLDALNRAVFAGPEESAARVIEALDTPGFRIGENRIGTRAEAAAARAADAVRKDFLESRRVAEEMNRPTVLESMPAGKAAGLKEASPVKPPRAPRGEPKTQVDAAPYGHGQTPTVVEQAPRGALDARMDQWLQVPRIRPFQEAEAKMQAAMADLYSAAGGRLDSAGALGILEKSGLKRSADPMVSHADALWSMRRAGRLAADEARGVATPLRDAAMDTIKQVLGGKLISKALGGHALGVATALMGFGGRLGAASGRLLGKAVASVAKLLTSTQVRAVAVAAGNNAWAYDEQGPIKDPVERIKVVQAMANNPDGVRAMVAQQMGQLGQVDPALLKALQDKTVAQVTHIAMRAPAIYYDRLGNALMPPAGKMRQFYEYENGIHDLESLLTAVGNGSITTPQAAALQEGWPSVHVKMAQAFLQDPEKLRSLSRGQLRVVQMVTGLPLTNASDPMFLARQGQAWAPIDAPGPNTPKPQAFNINPDGAPTPSQSSNGRAPGN